MIQFILISMFLFIYYKLFGKPARQQRDNDDFEVERLGDWNKGFFDWLTSDNHHNNKNRRECPTEGDDFHREV